MQTQTFVDGLHLTPLTIAMNTLSAVSDVLITGSLVVLLHWSRTGFRRSDTIINQLILFVVNTGMLTSCIAVGALVSITASPDTLIYVPFYFCIGRFYVNSLLATLNARKHIGRANDGVIDMLEFIPASVVASDFPNGKTQPNIPIRIDTTREREGSDDDIVQDRQRDSDYGNMAQKSLPL